MRTFQRKGAQTGWQRHQTVQPTPMGPWGLCLPAGVQLDPLSCTACVGVNRKQQENLLAASEGHTGESAQYRRELSNGFPPATSTHRAVGTTAGVQRGRDCSRTPQQCPLARFSRNMLSYKACHREVVTAGQPDNEPRPAEGWEHNSSGAASWRRRLSHRA